ncbi:predicted protein [Uncinocarpus reesii 1704]|uniref:F-box domain-containing protein n=1 Tax=Uncinocarpus reesii (strain UAMH 1704) TaxID=336963 RepID=C4JSI4_UNCRE|nr:uncharacterized protein UREG_05423 [Uncinocarpus reesii 1704]EEP80581.1 predicted protein [Uncinocarpus reesii 1704]
MCRNILDDSILKSHVRKVYVNTIEEDWESEPENGGNFDHGYETDDYEPSLETKAQMSLLTQFPLLEHITLRFEKNFTKESGGFYSDYPPQNLEFRLEVLQWFFSSLVASSVRPRSLAFRNIHSIALQDPAMLDLLAQMLHGLRALRLNVSNQRQNGDYGYVVDNPHTFEQLPSDWLSPTKSTLEHLTLYSNQPFGLFPKLDLSSIHFPRLKSLALGQYEFFHDDQLDWIISHGPTLRELYLDNCIILHAIVYSEWEQGHLHRYHPSALSGKWDEVERSLDPRTTRYIYTTRWHDYFAMFRTGLPLLQHFRIGKSMWCHEFPFEKEREIEIGLFEDRYLTWDGGFHTRSSDFDIPEELGDISSCDEEDKDALLALFQKIGQNVPEREGGLVCDEQGVWH